MALSIICSPLNGLLESNVYAWFVHQTGVASNIAQTTVPFFLGASAFGAANGFIEQTIYSLKEKIKKGPLIRQSQSSNRSRSIPIHAHLSFSLRHCHSL